MGFVLRGYQENSVNSMCDFFKDPKPQNEVGISPTGSGKSILISETAKRLQEEMIVMAPKKELVRQNFHKYFKYGFRNADVFCAGLGRKKKGMVTFGTVQSMVNAIPLFKGIKNVVIDECHGVSPDDQTMYQKFLTGVGAEKVFGLSAAPIRNYRNMNGVSYRVITNTKEKFFKKIRFCVPVQHLVENEWWSPLKYMQYEFDASKLRRNSTGRDFTPQSVALAININNTNDLILHHLRKADPDKSILIYGASAKIAEEMSEKVRSSAFIGSKTEKNKREDLLDAWLNGKIKRMFNFGVFKEGLDFPGLDGIMLGRPYGSLGEYLQACGRVVRITESMKTKVIADYCGNVQRFGEIEEIDFKEVAYDRRKGTKWELFRGNVLLTGINAEDIGSKLYFDGKIIKNPRWRNNGREVTHMPFGQHYGEPVHQVPDSYLKHISGLPNCDHFVFVELRRRGLIK